MIRTLLQGPVVMVMSEDADGHVTLLRNSALGSAAPLPVVTGAGTPGAHSIGRRGAPFGNAGRIVAVEEAADAAPAGEGAAAFELDGVRLNTSAAFGA
jgi:hypothetical protein